MFKKSLLILSLFFMFVFILEVNAVQNNKINKDPIHEELLKTAIKNKKNTKSEYDFLKDLYKLPKEELEKLNLSQNDLNKYESEMLKVIKYRSKLTKDKLHKLGYNDQEISLLRSIDESTTLNQVAIMGLFANCTVYNGLGSHTFDGEYTHFIVYFGWSWDKPPIYMMTDSFGFGWEPLFGFNSNATSTYNKVNIKYQNYDSDYYYISLPMTESVIRGGNVQFDMSELDIGQDLVYWAQSGYGNAYFIAGGIEDDAAFACLYGHNKGGLTPKITTGGVELEFSYEEDTFAPPMVVSSHKYFG